MSKSFITMFRTFFKTLRAKILTGFIVVIFIMIVVMIWSLYNFNRLNESFRAIIVENYSSIVAADNMVRSLDNQINGLFLILNKDNTQHGSKMFDDAKQDFFYWYEKAREAAYTKDEIVILDSMNAKYKTFLSEISFILNNHILYPSHEDQQNEYSKAIMLISEVKSDCYKIFETNHKFIKNSEESVQSITHVAAYTMLFLAVIGTIISLVFSTKFSKFIVKPVKDLTRSVKHISAGNFESVINSEDSDEIGILADEFKNMVGRLKRYEKLNINKILYEKKKSDTIIESINDPVLMVDERMVILLINKAFEEEFGKPNSGNTMLGNLIENNKVCEHVKSFVEGNLEKESDNSFKIPTKEGFERFYKLKFSIINLPENEVKAVLIVFNDITKYEELDRLKSEFVAKVSHELKTPLTSMGMAIDIIGEGVVGPISDKQSELVLSMKEDYLRLNRLVKEILQLSSIESGGIKLNFNSTDLNELLGNTVKAFSLQCKDKRINLIYNFNDSLPLISGDYDALSSAFGNFIGNSIKFTDKGGEINIDTEFNDKNIVVIISDTGAGINAEYLDKIFDKFVQVSGSKPGSVGLGLSIAKEIIELHQGSINVWSKPGLGSKFMITIPVLKNG